jgi:transporter family-2 protein
MPKMILVGLAVALASGLMTGIQATLFTVVGRTIGPARASPVLNVIGGILAGLILIGAIGIQGREQWSIPRSALVSASIAVAIGMLIITGVAFSFQRTGVAAGIAAVFLGQMLIGVIVDIWGGSGGETVPLDGRRVIGLIIVAAGVLLLLPRE